MKLTPRKVLAALGVSALAFAAPAFAGQEAEVAAAATTSVEASTPTGPALWKVADEDTTIYLFGTVHALPKDVEWSSSVLENALVSSDSVVTEIKMTPEMPTEMQQLVMTKGILPAETTLRSLLNPEQTATYEAAMGKLGIPAAAFDRFEPWYAGMMMSMLPLLQQGYSPDAGVEKVILTKAGDKDQQALETIAFQIGIFDQLPQESQVNFLVEASAGIDEIKPMLDKMVAEWLEGDADALAALMNEGLTDPKVADALLYSRNRNWAQWIDTRLETPGTVFVAVGAGHLAGKESVQDALSALGIETVRVQ
ncbi:TraB/GumN family protein [Altererythrobacter litoralis]|uniref:TraB/GumN family protein n=1 Tax=Altererythrobacter litoralis TaxID=3113904 RepID=A0ABU7GH57_9SPHN|nr:TraB/GumN family protein [Erythrobacteraceae bacterium 1XM1-14]